PAKPLPRYPETKGAAEKLVQAANSTQMQAMIVRPRFIWGNDDTSVLTALLHAVKSGRFMWMNGGRYMTSTTHVDNVCEGLMLAAEKGKGGEIYFVTDGAPVELRQFVTQLLATQGVDPGGKSMPKGIVQALARVTEWVWETFGLKGAPPVTRMAAHLFGEPVTINDAKARRELGYQGKTTREKGLAELKKL
ncbi:MAG: NAD-dependent epimerase/dehydratase family protein, partial [Hydrocarboniphaga effusa]|nr:NAD-dependent epimerase/dehydratase family protein [Hydrocarboniphaga effusa]